MIIDYKEKCFIHSLDPKIIKELHYLGYIEDETQKETVGDYIVAEDGLYRLSPEKPSGNDYIDCKENIDLFNSIIALTEDSDLHQWFIYDNKNLIGEDKGFTGWIKCESDSIDKFLKGFDIHGEIRKANKKELLKYFIN